MLPRSLKPFLLIGSAKSGTTSLFADICQHPDVFLPPEKEPGDLCHDSVLTPEGREKYLSVFRAAPEGARVGDATTFYTSRDKYPGVPERAKAVLGEDVKILFIGRDPVERLKSHYRQLVILGHIDGALRDLRLEKSDLLFQSKYDYQLEPWWKAFRRDQILMLAYEDYARTPELVVRRIWQHLEIKQVDGKFGQRKNISADRYVRRGFFANLLGRQLYKGKVRNVIPHKIKESLKPILLKKPKFLNELPADRERELRRELMDACRNFYAMAERFE